MWRAGDRCDYVEGTHDAYAPLVHTRSVLALHGLGWLVVDHLLGAGDADAIAAWHLAPDWTAADGSGTSAHLVCGDASSAIVSTAQMEVVADICSPIYGLLLPSTTLRARAAGPLPMSFATFVATAEVTSGLTIEPVAVHEAPGAAWHAAAFNVFWTGGCLRAMTAIECAGAPDDDNAAPAAVWGTRELRTDARTAALIVMNGRAAEVLLINGSTVAAATGTVQLAEGVRMARLPTPPAVASSVHQLALNERGGLATND
jgi:hypothetical protein